MMTALVNKIAPLVKMGSIKNTMKTWHLDREVYVFAPFEELIQENLVSKKLKWD